MKTLRILTSGLALAATCLGMSGAAGAALITEWRFDAVNDWANTTFSSPGPGAPTNNFLVSDTLPDGSDPNGSTSQYDIIRWGTPAPGSPSRSFLALDDVHGSDGLFTNDPNGIAGTTVYHGNYRQLAAGQQWLDTTTAVTTITVTPVTPDGDPIGPIQRDFFINFTETIDTQDNGACPGGPWAPDIAPCPDSFTVDLSEASFSVAIDEYIYTFSLLLLDEAGSENIAKLIIDNGQATVWTEEGVRSKLVTRVVVEAQRIPEPAPLALLGGGLALAGLLGQRRKRGADATSRSADTL